jgi:hypothetical protein
MLKLRDILVYVDLREAFSVLELGPGASREDVRDARNTLVKVWHPDRHEGDPKVRAHAERKLRHINEAYAVIEAAGFPRALQPPPRAPQPQAAPAPPNTPLGRIRWQLAQEQKLWAIAHLDDVAQGGRNDELAFWISQYERGIPNGLLISPPPYGKRTSPLLQQATDAFCAAHPHDGRRFLEAKFLHYIVPPEHRVLTTEPPPPRVPDPPAHAELRFDFLVSRIANELVHISSWTAEPLTFRPGPFWAKLDNLHHVVGHYVDRWAPPDDLLLRATDNVRRKALLAPSVARYARVRALVTLARALSVEVTRAEKQLDWVRDALQAAAYATGLPATVELPSRGLRGELEDIQMAFLDRFQPDGYTKLIALIKDAMSRLSKRNENADALVRLASVASILDPQQGTEMILRFTFPGPLPAAPTETYPS